MAVYRFSEVRGTLICTSTTRPSTPSPGDRIYETDTGKEMQYQGPNNGWTLPWGVAWGEESRITKLTTGTGQTAMANGTDMTGFNVVWTPTLNRRYKMTAFCELVPSATTLTNMGISVTDSVIGQLNRTEVANNQLLGVGVICTAEIQGPTAVAHTTKVTAILGGTGTLSTANFASTRPAFIIIEDIGPNSAPT